MQECDFCSAVLNKESRLTDEEFEHIKKHPQIGADILNKSHRLSELSNIVLVHDRIFIFDEDSVFLLIFCQIVSI